MPVSMTRAESYKLKYKDRVICGDVLCGEVRDTRATGLFIKWDGSDATVHGDLIEHQSPLIGLLMGSESKTTMTTLLLAQFDGIRHNSHPCVSADRSLYHRIDRVHRDSRLPSGVTHHSHSLSGSVP